MKQRSYMLTALIAALCVTQLRANTDLEDTLTQLAQKLHELQLNLAGSPPPGTGTKKTPSLPKKTATKAEEMDIKTALKHLGLTEQEALQQNAISAKNTQLQNKPSESAFHKLYNEAALLLTSLHIAKDDALKLLGLAPSVEHQKQDIENAVQAKLQEPGADQNKIRQAALRLQHEKEQLTKDIAKNVAPKKPLPQPRAKSKPVEEPSIDVDALNAIDIIQAFANVLQQKQYAEPSTSDKKENFLNVLTDIRTFVQANKTTKLNSGDIANITTAIKNLQDVQNNNDFMKSLSGATNDTTYGTKLAQTIQALQALIREKKKSATTAVSPQEGELEGIFKEVPAKIEVKTEITVTDLEQPLAALEQEASKEIPSLNQFKKTIQGNLVAKSDELKKALDEYVSEKYKNSTIAPTATQYTDRVATVIQKLTQITETETPNLKKSANNLKDAIKNLTTSNNALIQRISQQK